MEDATNHKVLADLTKGEFACGPGGIPDAAEILIEDYLDHMNAPLVGLIPVLERRRIRQEAAYHLDRAVRTYMMNGCSAEDAARKAIEEYGDSRALSGNMLQEWMERRVGTNVTRMFSRPVVIATACFSFAQAAVLILQQVHIVTVELQSNPPPITLGLSPAQVRQIIPRPLPLPESSPTFVLLILALLILPLVAGFLCGWMVPVRAVRATYQVIVSLTLSSFFAGFLMLPACYGLLTAMFQLVYWLPFGCIAAHFGVTARQWRAFHFDACRAIEEIRDGGD